MAHIYDTTAEEKMTLFPEWQEEHKDDAPLLPERIRAMHNMYGKTEDKVCRLCTHLLRYHAGSNWLKCNISKMTSSVATDWKAGWPACGKYEE